MHDQLWWTEKLNLLIGGPVTAFLHALGVHPHDPHNPITDFVAMQLVVVVFLIAFFAVIRSRLSVDSPGKLQHVTEVLYDAVRTQADDILGHHSKRYVPFVMTLAFFILVSNLLGLIPGFLSPTQFPSVPLGLALTTWVYYHAHGLRQQGVLHYVAHFAGPVPWWLKPGMFLIEIISHCARVLSLTIRLYANMYAGEMVTLAFFSLVPIAVPVVFLGLHTMVAFVQTLIFVILTLIYLAGAVGDEH
jgi:F-type H+-transporting ATPase subunit a